jgi:C4-type Zn-finger protein
MNKRQRKKFLFKGNCPKCMNDNKVKFLRIRNNDLKYFMKNQWVVCSCDCGYEEIK